MSKDNVNIEIGNRITSAVNYIMSLKGFKRQTEVAKLIGRDETNISKAKKGNLSYTDTYIEAICSVFPEFSKTWLLTGKGEMLISPYSQNKNILTQNESLPTDVNYKLVPVVHIDSVGGMQSNNAIVDMPQFIEGYVPFVNAQDRDRAIYQSGNSMIPTIPPGSLMQIREVPNWREYFGYGNIFVIELKDGRRITKEVERYEENPKEYIWCKSHNPDVADEELPKSMIVSVWKVIKILTDKGW